MPFIQRTESGHLTTSGSDTRIFICRTDELQFFVANILQADQPLHNIISLYGQAGIGKSTLLTRFIELATSSDLKINCAVAIVDERQTTPISIMERFAEQLKFEGNFKKELNNYKESLRKLQSEQEATREAFWRNTTTSIASTLAHIPQFD